MKCQDVRLLLAFTARPSEAVDAAERAAVAQHLQGCPDCAALAQSERALDGALSAVMRDVPVPTDLKPKVMKRLAASRGMGRWKGPIAAAAGLLLAAAGGLGYHLHWSRAVVTDDELSQIISLDRWQGGNAEEAQQYLNRRGLSVIVPEGFDYNRFLQTIEIVDFRGRRVAKLGFAGNGTSAYVLILPDKQFRVAVVGSTISDWDVAIRHPENGDCSYLIYFRGQLDELQPRLN